MFTTCDVDLATPVVTEAIKRGVLAVAPCIGTDQMGPKRFGAKGRLAFSFGNVAQDEGSAMAEYAFARAGGPRTSPPTRCSSTSRTSSRRSTSGSSSSAARSSTRESYATGANNVGAAVSRLNAHKADVVVTSTAFGELPALVSGLRALATRRRSSTRGRATAPTG